MGKSAKTKLARKRAKQKKIIIIIICSVIAAVVIAALVFFFLNQQNSERVYAFADSTITLRDDGSFNALLFHDVSFNGTYSEITQDNTTIVSFTYDGITVNGRIVGKILTLPEEWDDDHGHGMEYTLK